MPKKYTKAQKLEALRVLAEQCGNLAAAAEHTGIHRRSIARWRERFAKEYEDIDRHLFRQWLVDARAAAVRQARAKITSAGPGEAARVAKDMDGLLRLDGGQATERVHHSGDGTTITIRYEDATKPADEPEDAE